ncbi:hypothetical protein U1Q18_013126, partial [Sarracenia purpurea var. burkii]
DFLSVSCLSRFCGLEWADACLLVSIRPKGFGFAHLVFDRLPSSVQRKHISPSPSSAHLVFSLWQQSFCYVVFVWSGVSRRLPSAITLYQGLWVCTPCVQSFALFSPAAATLPLSILHIWCFTLLPLSPGAASDLLSFSSCVV